MVKDMTKGKPFPIIMSFFIPMLLGNMFQQFYNLVDTVIVGKLVGLEALAAVGSTGSISFLIIGFTNGITTGFSIKIAQSFGAGDIKKLRRYLVNAAAICVVLSVVMTTLTVVFIYPLLQLMQTPPEIIGYAYDYTIMIFGGITATIFYNFLAGVLRAVGDSKTPIFFLAIACLLNIVLDLFFILVFDMEVAGAGLATVISQFISAVLCYFFIRKNYDVLRVTKKDIKINLRECIDLIVIGVPMALQFSITAIGSIILQTAVNGLGTIIVAAVTAGNKIQQLVWMPIEAISITIATYCGQNLGAGRYRRIQKGVNVGVLVCLTYCMLATVVIWFFGKSASLLFLDANYEHLDQVLIYVQTFLRYHASFYWSVGLLMLYRNALQGLGYSAITMFGGALELISRAVLAIGLIGMLGFTAVCLAGPAAWISAFIFFIVVYLIKMKRLKKELTGPDAMLL